ncbi:HEAT repeat domain-containing protein [Zunongwangia endophytica]|uniref:HEAT repeat domain-containing protein n=1 Tax=Zunongwangia endophytica TaxID=1808945 RepID=A0ABV8HEM0_9FLAO|nr:HEAT repeat domain-containing protein [Zunongwangia endophytica]MDN3594323.1 HEAT repeat domain-containing protein [Zunongwangia endophytica]
MEIWQYIEILRRPNKTWFFSKDNTEEKINALIKIANEGYSNLICSLTEFLKDDNNEIRETTSKTITHLFKKIDSKKGYYNTLKHCGISKSDIDFYEANFPKDQYVELLAISSLNGSGYVREKAVKKLSQIDSSRAIQFLIYRLADWVLPVRQAALNGINNYKTTNYIDSLIDNLPIFEWLQKVERTNLSGVYQDIIKFIASTNRVYVIENFKKYPDKIRLLLAKHISISLTQKSAELKLLLNDKHFLIRNLAIEHFEMLGESEIDQLLNDKSAKIRLQTLYCLKDQSEFKTIVKGFLADSSATIRNFARFTLKHSNIDFAKFYNDNLQENKQVIGSLSGLAETEGKQYLEIVKSYLKDKKIKIKKTAFLALCKLDEECAYDFAFANLDSQYIGLRNVIIEFLSHIPRQEILTKAKTIYETGNYELKKSMLKLFNKVGGWTAIPDLMIGTIDENENIRQLAFGYLQIWRTRAVRLFSTPKQGEVERAKQIFSFVNETHEDKQYFKTNPVSGLDFYFK